MPCHNCSRSFSYDANGNLIAHGTRTYNWDAENRLVQVADDGTPIANFTYDGAGRRASKIAGGATRNFVYDGSSILEDRIVSGLTTRHIHGWVVDRPLASVDSAGNPTYYLADHLGTIVQTTDASGTVTLTRQYDPYGNLLQGDTTSGYALTGREWDAEIGLYYYRARYYDPSAGRFISADPIGLGGGANFYAYVRDNPTNLVDPLGLAPNDGSFLQEMNPLNSNGTLYKEANSIIDSLWGMLTGNWKKVACAYNNSPLGLTAASADSADPFNKYVGYYGVRTALTVGAAADLAAGGLMALDALGISNLGDWEVGWKGGEFTLKDPTSPFKGPDFRLNPLGDWKSSNPNARPPHWHQRPGIGNHLPWDWWF